MSDVAANVARIRSQIGDVTVDAGLVLGNGVVAIADQAEDAIAIPYADLPGFKSSAAIAQPTLVIGRIGAARLAILRGRENYNEGGDIGAMRIPLETIALLGAKSVVLTGPCASVKPDIQPGAMIAISDHLNLTGINPLIGIRDPKRYVDLSNIYDRTLRERFALVSSQLGRKTYDGVYMWFPSPSFETEAEARAAHILGADVTGIAFVPEAIIARFLGLRVLALATVTNMAAGLRPGELTVDAQLRIGAAVVPAFVRMLAKFFDLTQAEGRGLR